MREFFKYYGLAREMGYSRKAALKFGVSPMDDNTKSRPSLAHQIAETRKIFRAGIAAKAVTDMPINLKRKPTPEAPKPEINASLSFYWPPAVWDMEPLGEFVFPHPEKIESFIPESRHPDEFGFSIKDIQRAVCRIANINFSDLISSRRTTALVEVRHVAVLLCKHLTTWSLPEIGRKFGGRNHTTILYTVRKMTPLLPEINRRVPCDSTVMEWAQHGLEVFYEMGQRNKLYKRPR